jgi:hypothetical protein
MLTNENRIAMRIDCLSIVACQHSRDIQVKMTSRIIDEQASSYAYVRTLSTKRNIETNMERKVK